MKESYPDNDTGSIVVAYLYSRNLKTFPPFTHACKCCECHGMISPLVLPDNGKSRNHVVWRLKVGTATVIFCLSVSAVPIYNKLVFAEGVCDGKACLRKYPFPMATAFLQLSLVSLVLTAANIVGHFWEPDQSWIFGPHPLYKLRHVGPVGLLFGFKYGVTNWGLQILPVGHLVKSGLIQLFV